MDFKENKQLKDMQKKLVHPPILSMDNLLISLSKCRVFSFAF